MKELLEALAKSASANAEDSIKIEVMRLAAKHHWSIEECGDVIDFVCEQINNTCMTAAEIIKATAEGMKP